MAGPTRHPPIEVVAGDRWTIIGALQNTGSPLDLTDHRAILNADPWPDHVPVTGKALFRRLAAEHRASHATLPARIMVTSHDGENQDFRP
jgi:hypothetical protein